MTDEPDPPRSHREIAAQMADEWLGVEPEYALTFLMVGMIHGILALVDELEDATLAMVPPPMPPPPPPSDEVAAFKEWRDSVIISDAQIAEQRKRDDLA